MSKMKDFKRFLALSLAFVLAVTCVQYLVLADMPKQDTLVIYEEDGTVTYQTITEQETLEVDESVFVKNMYDEKVYVEQNSGIDTFSSSDLQPVSILSLGVAPYKCACILSVEFPNGRRETSSGILVNKNVVLTSAHGVNKSEYGGSAKSIIVYVGAYYDAGILKFTQGVGYKKQIIIHNDWAEKQLPKADWALVTLTENFEIYQTCGYSNDYTKSPGRSVTIIGYPDGKDFCYSKGKITGTTDYKWNEADRGLWTTSAKTVKGMSGGPVIDDSTGVVIGVVKGEDEWNRENVDVPLTKLIINAIKTYSN